MEYDLEKRFKIMEEKIYVLYQLVQNLETTNNDKLSNFDKKMEQIFEELEEIKKQIDNINVKIRSIIDQLSLFALSDKVEYIEKLLDYIDPYNFVTKKEVEDIVDKKIKEYLGKTKKE